jgi:hypothetical protein
VILEEVIMSYDIHIAKTHRGATYRQPSYRLSESLHEYIISKKLCGKHFILNRIQDYYSDASFDYSEIHLLIQELYILEKEYSNDAKIFEFVANLKKICDMALQSRENIYFFAD